MSTCLVRKGFSPQPCSFLHRPADCFLLIHPLALTFHKHVLHPCCVPILGQGLGIQCPAQASEGGHSMGRTHTKQEGRVHARFFSADPHSQETLSWQQNTLRKHLLEE